MPGCPAVNRPTTNTAPFLFPPNKKIVIDNQLRHMEMNALILSRIMLETVVKTAEEFTSNGNNSLCFKLALPVN